jgi:lysophospholipase L1-like esterase
MKKLFYFLLFTFLLVQSKAQQTWDSSFRYYYYDQKLTMFDLMLTPKNPIIWVGDSITDMGEWSEFFPNYNTLNRGISSDITFGVLNRMYEIIRHKPKKVFIMIGINDISRNIPDEVIVNNYRRMIDSLQQKTPLTKIYMQSVLPTNNTFTLFKNHQNKNEHILFVNNELKKICREKKVTYVNLYDAFLISEGTMNPLYTNDGLHLTGEGFLKWKEVLLLLKAL